MYEMDHSDDMEEQTRVAIEADESQADATQADPTSSKKSEAKRKQSEFCEHFDSIIDEVIKKSRV